MKKIFPGLLLAFTIAQSATNAQNLASDTGTLSPEPRHHFLVQLPEQISFKVSLISLDDWDSNEFSTIVNNQVKKHIAYFEDSMHNNPTLQNILNVEKNANSDFEKLNFRQVPPMTTELVFKEGSYYNLKNSMDSLFYTSYTSNPKKGKGKEKSLNRNLLTISAKSLSDLNNLSITQIRAVRQQLDSMVNAVKVKSKNYRSPLYSSNSSWSLSPEGKHTPGFTDQKPFMKVVNNFKLGVGYGAIVFNNSISPTMELSMGYVLKRSQQSATFIGFNYSLFTEIDFRNRNNLVGYLPFHLEFGTISNNVGLMQRKTSIGYGVMIKSTQQYNIPATYYLPSMQLNFGISNTISSSLMIATQLKKDAEHYVLGVSLKYNL